jgi:hypothetical protein
LPSEIKEDVKMREGESMNVVDQDGLDEGMSHVPLNSHVWEKGYNSCRIKQKMKVSRLQKQDASICIEIKLRKSNFRQNSATTHLVHVDK